MQSADVAGEKLPGRLVRLRYNKRFIVVFVRLAERCVSHRRGAVIEWDEVIGQCDGGPKVEGHPRHDRDPFVEARAKEL